MPKMATYAQPDTATPNLSAHFDVAARGVAGLFSLNLDDVRDAYATKKESLTLLFNNANKDRSDRNSYIGWSVFWGILFWPVALYTGYKAYDAHTRLTDAKDNIREEISIFKAANAHLGGMLRLKSPAPKA